MIIKRHNIEQREFAKKRGNGITQADIDKALEKKAKKDAAKGKTAPSTPQQTSSPVVQNSQPKPAVNNNLPAVVEKPKTTNLPSVVDKPKTTSVPTTMSTVNKSMEKVGGKSKGFLGKFSKGQKIAGVATLGAAAVGSGLYAYKKHKNNKQS